MHDFYNLINLLVQLNSHFDFSHLLIYSVENLSIAEVALHSLLLIYKHLALYFLKIGDLQQIIYSALKNQLVVVVDVVIESYYSLE